VPVELATNDRHLLEPLFEDCRYDRVLIDTVLEGYFGTAYTDSVSHPTVARLDSGAFTLLGGDPGAAGVTDLLHLAPISYVTPQSDEWRRRLKDEFGARVSALPFVDFSTVSLDPIHLARLAQLAPPRLDLVPIDRSLVEQLPSDMENPYFLENYQSADDFLERGLGYCILNQNRIVSAATSTARSRKAIDIEIATVPDYRRQGLGTVVGARLVATCLERGLEPRWLAANAASEALALKLGYVREETYETLAIEA
jgi:GNAT superfamily N-acetyltransferase